MPSDHKKNIRRLRNFPVNRKFIGKLRAELAAYMDMHPPVSPGLPAQGEARPRRQPGGLIGRESRGFQKTWAWFPGSRTAVLASAAGIFAIFSGTALAARGSLPGDALYPVKLAGENVRLNLTRAPERRAELELSLAKKRLLEIHTALEDQDRSSDDIGPALDNFNNRVQQAASSFEDLRKEDKTRRALEMAKDFQAALQLYREALKPEYEPENDGAKHPSEAVLRLQSAAAVAEREVEILESDAKERHRREGVPSLNAEINAIDSRIKNLEDRAGRSGGSRENKNSARERLEKAKTLLEEARESSGSELDDSIEKTQKSQSLTAEAKALIEEAPKIKFRAGRRPDSAPSSEREGSKREKTDGDDEGRKGGGNAIPPVPRTEDD